MPNYRFRAVVDIDVKNADSESEAREKAFGIMSGANATPARGRTPSGARASVTGVVIEDPLSPAGTLLAIPKLMTSEQYKKYQETGSIFDSSDPATEVTE